MTARNQEELARLARRSDRDRRLALQASSEPEHYAKQAKTASSLYLLVMAIALLTGIGAGFGAALTLAALLRAVLGGIAFGAQTFSTNVITLSVAPAVLACTLGLVLAIGLLGELGPAWRAAALRPIEALRRT